MQPPTPSRDRFIANRSAIDLDVARYALDSSTNGINATSGDGSSASQPDSLVIASPSKVRGKFSIRYGKFLCVVFYFRSFCRRPRARERCIYLFSSFLSSSASLFSFALPAEMWKRSVSVFFFTKSSFRLMKDVCVIWF